MKIHKHILVDARVRNPVSDVDIINDWLRELVAKVNMEVFIDPQSKYCDDPTNAGTTGIIVITTSHSSIHIWEGDDPFLKMDLYSCKEFEVGDVLSHFDIFDPIEIHYSVVDRTSHPHHISEQGYINNES